MEQPDGLDLHRISGRLGGSEVVHPELGQKTATVQNHDGIRQEQPELSEEIRTTADREKNGIILDGLNFFLKDNSAHDAR